MQFDHLHYLWFLMLIPFLAALSARNYERSNQWLYRFARKKRPLLPQLLSIALLSFTVAATILSLAEPRISVVKTGASRAAIDLVVGIDVSKSMLAEDISLPGYGRRLFQLNNRLNRARLFVLNAVAELHGEKIALFVFASGGVEVVPLTGDYGYCNYIVKHMNDAEITVPGSDLGAAIQTGLAALESSGEDGAKVMVLLSDGEDISLDKSSLDESATQAASRGIRIYTVGVGGTKEALIPMRRSNGMTLSGYYRDEAGSLLITTLVRETLQTIAQRTGGRYYEAGHEQSAREVVAAILRDAETSGDIGREETIWLPLSPWLLLAALVFTLIEIFAVGYYRAVAA